MNKELITVDKKEVVLYEPANIMTLLSSIGLSTEFRVMKEKQMAFIAAQLPALYREKEVYGRQNSQVTSKLMSLTMLKFGVGGALKQIGAQIENKREALKENTIKLAKLKNEVEELEEKLGTEDNKYRVKDIELDIMKKKMDLADSRVHLEQAFREIYMFLQTRLEIMEAHNIPEDFDEEFFVKLEIKENLQSAFQNAFRDILSGGHINISSEEWVSQFGVHPAIAVIEVQKYLATLTDSVDINHFYKWLDDMHEKYGAEWRKAAKRVGIKEIFTKECAYVEPLRGENDEEVR